MAKKIRKSEAQTASSEDAVTFVTHLQKKFQRKKRSPKESERLRKYLAKYSADYLRSIARRVMIDIVKGPGQTTAHGDNALPQPAKAGGTGPKATRRPVGNRATRSVKSTTARSRRKSTKS